MTKRLYLERLITLLILFSTILFLIAFIIQLHEKDYKIDLMIFPLIFGVILVIYYSIDHINYQTIESPALDRQVWFRFHRSK